MPENVTRLRAPERQASILRDKAKKARDHATVLYLAMVGAQQGGNGLDFYADELMEAAGDLESELTRLVSEMDA